MENKKEIFNKKIEINVENIFDIIKNYWIEISKKTVVKEIVKEKNNIIYFEYFLDAKEESTFGSSYLVIENKPLTPYVNIKIISKDTTSKKYEINNLGSFISKINNENLLKDDSFAYILYDKEVFFVSNFIISKDSTIKDFLLRFLLTIKNIIEIERKFLISILESSKEK